MRLTSAFGGSYLASREGTPLPAGHASHQLGKKSLMRVFGFLTYPSRTSTGARRAA